MAAWRGHFQAALESALIIEPGVRVVLDRLEEPEVLAAFSHAHSERLMGSSPSLDQDSAYVRVFLHRHAGTQVVWMLLTSDEAGGEFPSRRPIPVSIAACAKRFSVSRTHLKRLFDDAEREGLLRWEPAGAVVLQEEARAFIRFLYSAQLVQLLVAAAQTARQLVASTNCVPAVEMSPPRAS